LLLNALGVTSRHGRRHDTGARVVRVSAGGQMPNPWAIAFRAVGRHCSAPLAVSYYLPGTVTRPVLMRTCWSIYVVGRRTHATFVGR
jgi:hypothetical protein